jgi:hypothetical protein
MLVEILGRFHHLDKIIIYLRLVNSPTPEVFLFNVFSLEELGFSVKFPVGPIGSCPYKPAPPTVAANRAFDSLGAANSSPGPDNFLWLILSPFDGSSLLSID